MTYVEQQNATPSPNPPFQADSVTFAELPDSIFTITAYWGQTWNSLATVSIYIKFWANESECLISVQYNIRVAPKCPKTAYFCFQYNIQFLSLISACTDVKKTNQLANTKTMMLFCLLMCIKCILYIYFENWNKMGKQDKNIQNQCHLNASQVHAIYKYLSIYEIETFNFILCFVYIDW